MGYLKIALYWLLAFIERHPMFCLIMLLLAIFTPFVFKWIGWVLLGFLCLALIGILVVTLRFRKMKRQMEEQMRSFIIVAGSEEEQVRLLDEQSFDLSKGMRVRVTGGMFEGAEGVLTKVSGARDRRVVVRIEGVAAVAAPTIDARLIEPID